MGKNLYGGEERLRKWKESHDIDETSTASEVIDMFKDRFSIMHEDIADARKIIAVRYGIAREGFSSRRAYIISENISVRKCS